MLLNAAMRSGERKTKASMSIRRAGRAHGIAHSRGKSRAHGKAHAHGKAQPRGEAHASDRTASRASSLRWSAAVMRNSDAFYVNRAGSNLSARQREVLNRAKHELRHVFGRDE